MTATTHSEFGALTDAIDIAAAFPDSVKGKTILITGVNKLGIGFSTAEALATQSPKVLILAGRSSAKLQECIDALKPKYSSVDFRPLILDLSSQSAVREGAKEFNSWNDVPSLDLLINNAGVMNIPDRQLSPEGIELTFATNHIGHFLFTNLIAAKLISAAKPSSKGVVRVVNVSSRAVNYGPVRFSDINLEKVSKDLAVSEQPGYESLQAMYPGDITGESYHPAVAYGKQSQ
jgi:NAD(P)-dependent dehydrogenase (short-subunit alcohol dehydrogenase family)